MADAGAQAEPKVKEGQQDGALPTVELGPTTRRFWCPRLSGTAISKGTYSLGEARSCDQRRRAYFTTSRVFLMRRSVYPFRASGKLFFTDPRAGSDHVCSASVLRKRVVVTAGHCVCNPSENRNDRYYFTNFMFVPAYTSGRAPYGRWTASRVIAADAFYLVDEDYPNLQDVAVMVMRDQKIGGKMRKIAEVTGNYGYRTGGLAKNNVTMLGYPNNLDDGERMEITNSTEWKFIGTNNYLYGTAFGQASSGGPWIEDFGISPTRGLLPNIMGRNVVVSVTSYGECRKDARGNCIGAEPDPKQLWSGGPVLDGRFVTILNQACGAAGTGNC